MELAIVIGIVILAHIGFLFLMCWGIAGGVVGCMNAGAGLGE